MPTTTFNARRRELETYFDHTAVEAWKRLTSQAPVSRIRQTVRAGRDRMRSILLDRIGPDLTGQSILGAGCGTGALAIEVARRGAQVTAIDLSEKLVRIGQVSADEEFGPGRIDFRVGNMLDLPDRKFDQIIAMDSLIHYRSEDMIAAVAGFADKSSNRILFTYAPRTPLLAIMHAVGRLFPRSNRAPSIVPATEHRLLQLISPHGGFNDWEPTFTERVASGFYTSQAMELTRL